MLYIRSLMIGAAATKREWTRSREGVQFLWLWPRAVRAATRAVRSNRQDGAARETAVARTVPNALTARAGRPAHALSAA